MLVFGIDPGATTGIAVFNTETKTIDMAEVYEAIHDDYDDKIRWLAEIMSECFELYKPADLELIAIETFVMRGVGGKQLQKLIGAYIAATPERIPVRHVYNTTVKKLVGGKGSDDKEAVAEGVARYFKSNKQSYDKICKIIGKEQWDLTDAFAIGIAGWMEYQNEK
jgi:Holliday junction resolvasome RuvABC endonuclease subunit